MYGKMMLFAFAYWAGGEVSWPSSTVACCTNQTIAHP
jgi:hypothetical protein